MNQLKRLVKRWTALVMVLTMILQPVMTSLAATPAEGLPAKTVSASVGATPSASAGATPSDQQKTDPKDKTKKAKDGTSEVTIKVVRYNMDEQYGEELEQTVTAGEEASFTLGYIEGWSFCGWKCEREGEDPIIAGYRVNLTAEEDTTFEFDALFVPEEIHLTVLPEGTELRTDNKTGGTFLFEAELTNDDYGWDTEKLKAGDVIDTGNDGRIQMMNGNGRRPMFAVEPVYTCVSADEDTLVFSVSCVPSYGGDETDLHFWFDSDLVIGTGTDIPFGTDNEGINIVVDDAEADADVSLDGTITGEPGQEGDYTLTLTLEDTGYTWNDNDGDGVIPGYFWINANGEFTSASLSTDKKVLTLSYHLYGEGDRHEPLEVYSVGTVLNANSENVTGTVTARGNNAYWNIGAPGYYLEGIDESVFRLWKGASEGSEAERRCGGENYTFTEAEGGGYQAEQWFLKKDPEREDTPFRGLRFENYANGKVIIYPADHTDTFYGISLTPQDGGWLITFDPNMFPAGCTMGIISEWRPFNGQFRLKYAREEEVSVSYEWEKNGQTGEQSVTQNQPFAYEEEAKQRFVITPPGSQSAFYGAIVKSCPMFGCEETEVFIAGQSEKLTENEDGRTWTLELFEEGNENESGYDIDLFWSEDEYLFETMSWDIDYNDYFIVDSWTNDNGTGCSISVDNAEESHSRFNGTRSKVSRDAESLTFNVDVPAGIAVSIRLNDQEYTREDLDSNGQLTVSKPEGGWPNWLNVNSDFNDDGETPRIFEISDIVITGSTGDVITDRELTLTIPENESGWRWSTALQAGDDVTGMVRMSHQDGYCEQTDFTYQVTSVSTDRKILTLLISGSVVAARDNIYVGTRRMMEALNGDGEWAAAGNEIGSLYNENAYFFVDHRRWITLYALVDGEETQEYTLTPGEDGWARGSFKLTLPEGKRFTQDAEPYLFYHQSSWQNISGLNVSEDGSTMTFCLAVQNPYGEDDPVEFNLVSCVEEYTEGSWKLIDDYVLNEVNDRIRISIPVQEKFTLSDTPVCGATGEDRDFEFRLTPDAGSGLYWSRNVLDQYSMEDLKNEHIWLNIEQEYYELRECFVNEDGELVLKGTVNAREGRGHNIQITAKELAAASPDAEEATWGQFTTHLNSKAYWNLQGGDGWENALRISDTEITGTVGGTYTARLTLTLQPEQLYFDENLIPEDIGQIVGLNTNGCGYQVSLVPGSLTERSMQLEITGDLSHHRDADHIYIELWGGVRNRNWEEEGRDTSQLFGFLSSEYNGNATWNVAGEHFVTISDGDSITAGTLEDFSGQWSFTLPDGYSWIDEIEDSINNQGAVYFSGIGTNSQHFTFVSCEDGELTLSASANVQYEEDSSMVFEFWCCIKDPDGNLIEHQILSNGDPSVRWNISAGGRMSMEPLVISGTRYQETEFELELTLEEDCGILWDPALSDPEGYDLNRISDLISLENMNHAHRITSYGRSEDGRTLTLAGYVEPYDNGTRLLQVYVDDLFVRESDTDCRLEGHLCTGLSEDTRWNIRNQDQLFTLPDIETPLYAGDSRTYTVNENGYGGNYEVEWSLEGTDGCIDLPEDQLHNHSITVTAEKYSGDYFSLKAEVTYEDDRKEWLETEIRLAPSFTVTGDGEPMLTVRTEEEKELSVEEAASRENDVTVTSVSWSFEDEEQENASLDSRTGTKVTLTGESASDGTVNLDVDIAYKRNEETFHEYRRIPVLVYGSQVPQFTVSYEPDGGSGYVAPQQFTAGNEIQLSAIGFTKEGYRAFYWLRKNTEERYTPGEYYSFTSDTVLVPQWIRVGWVEEEGNWHYYNEDGDRVCSDWVPGEAGRPYSDSEGGTYFVDDDGNLVRNGRICRGENYYATDGTGKMIRNGWAAVYQEQEGVSYQKTMYLGNDGKAYCDRDGVIAGRRYYFDEWAWTEPDYIVTLKEDNTENAAVAEYIELCYGNPAGMELPAPGRLDVRFYGWYTAPAGGTRISDLSGIRNDITLYPRGETAVTKYYTVEHRLQNLNSSGTYELQDSDNMEGRVGDMTEAAAKYYEGFTAQEFSQKEIPAGGEVTVVIRYDRNAYTVNFDVAGTGIEQPEAINGVYGESKTLPAVTAPEGQTFLGWYDGTQPVGASGAQITLTRDMTLVPRFAADGWQYDGTGWKYYIGDIARGEGWLGLPVGNPTEWYYIDRNGYMVQNQLIQYNWDYYYLGADGKRVKEQFVRLPATEDDRWTGLSERIYYFSANGKAKRDTLFTLNGNTYYFDNDGKAAVGFTDSGYGLKSADDENKAYDAEYYFDENGVMAKDCFLTFDVPERDEYSYLYEIWFYFGEDGRKVRNGRRINGLQYHFDGDTGVVLSGKRIVFDPNCEIGEYDDDLSDITVFPGRTITIPDAGFEREGYRFLGWKDTRNITYVPGSAYTVVNTRPEILTAQWEAVLWEVDTSLSEHASVTYTGNRTGETLEISVSPENGYGTVSVEAWALNWNGTAAYRLDVETVTPGTGYTLTMPACPIRITAKAETMRITAQPQAQFVKAGKTAKFTVTAAGEDLTYCWQVKTKSTGSWANTGESGAKTAALSVPVTAAKAGYQYRCIVTNKAGYSLISSAAALTVKPALVITKHPAAASAKSGKTVAFAVTATGDKISYQWQSSKDGKNWTDIAGTAGKKASLSVTVSTSNNGYQYHCIVTDSDNDKLTSNAAKLTMKAALTITKHPAAASAKSGKTVTFAVTATGDKISYQWQYSTNGKTWKNCSGTAAKKASYTVKVSTSNNGYQYHCIVTDSDNDKLTSNAAKLTMRAALKITKQPVSGAAAVGKTVTFKVTATGYQPAYQWQYSTDGKTWNNVSGTAAKKASYTVKVSKSNHGWQYRCNITDDTEKATTNAVKLSVTAPKITKQPSAGSAKSGKSVTFAVTASGSTLTYQWQYSTNGKTWKNVSGSAAKKASLAVKVSASNNGWQYRCVVTDCVKQTVTSKAVKLTLKK